MMPPKKQPLHARAGGAPAAAVDATIAFDVKAGRGLASVATDSPLSRLNFFDGRYLVAKDLTAEQSAQRALVFASNRAFGPGISGGLDLVYDPSKNELTLRAGLAIDPEGRVLLVPHDLAPIGVGELLTASAETGVASAASVGTGASTTGGAFEECVPLVAATGAVSQALALYVVELGHVDAACGSEDVVGLLCEDACVQGIARSRLVDGVVLRARRVDLGTRLVQLSANDVALRSRVASAYFDWERAQGEVLVGSATALYEAGWCASPVPPTGSWVPLGLLGRSATGTVLFDMWAARRERLEPAIGATWHARHRRRPLATFTAQIAHFQCHLREAVPNGTLGGLITGGRPSFGPVGDEAARRTLRRLASSGIDLGAFGPEIDALLQPVGPPLVSSEGGSSGFVASALLAQQGIVELPPAGYLPLAADVVRPRPPGGVDVQRQVRALLGPAVQAHYRIVASDEVAGEVAAAQHRDRIPLVRIAGAAPVPVEILVPDGRLEPGPEVEVRWNSDVVFTRQPVVRLENERNDGLAPLLRAFASAQGSLPGADDPLRWRPGPGFGRRALLVNAPVAQGVARFEPAGDGGHELRSFFEFRHASLLARLETSHYLRVAWDRDPFAAENGERVGFEVELAGRGFAGSTLSQLRVVEGEATFVGRRGAERIFTATATIVDADGTTSSLSFEASLQATRRPDFVVFLGLADLRIDGGQLEERYALALNRVGTEEFLLRVERGRGDADGQRQDVLEARFGLAPAVEAGGNANLVSARSAAERLGAVDDSARLRRLGAEVFAAPIVPEPELFATADWVAFRRLEAKLPVPPPVTIVIQPPPPDPPDSLVQVWHMRVDDPEDRERLTLRLREGGGPELVRARPLGVARFGADSAALDAASGDALRLQWPQAGGGATLHTVLSSPGVPARDGLAGDRGRAVMGVLAQVTDASAVASDTTGLAPEFSLLDRAAGAIVAISSSPVVEAPVGCAEVWILRDQGPSNAIFDDLQRARTDPGRRRELIARAEDRVSAGGLLVTRSEIRVQAGAVDQADLDQLIAAAQARGLVTARRPPVGFFVEDEALDPPARLVAVVVKEALDRQYPTGIDLAPVGAARDALRELSCAARFYLLLGDL